MLIKIGTINVATLREEEEDLKEVMKMKGLGNVDSVGNKIEREAGSNYA